MKIITLFFTLIIFSVTVQAATISIQTRGINQGVDSLDLIGSWSHQTSSIINESRTEFSGFQSGRNSFSHLAVNFDVGQPLTFGFEAGLDAHYGAEVFLDGSLIGKRTDDLWWSRNWNHSDVISLLGNSLLSGVHVLDLYWAEKCCDGPSSLRFTIDNTNWQVLSVANLESTFISAQSDSASIPEPITVLLLAFGGIGVTYNKSPEKYFNWAIIIQHLLENQLSYIFHISSV